MVSEPVKNMWDSPRGKQILEKGELAYAIKVFRSKVPVSLQKPIMSTSGAKIYDGPITPDAIPKIKKHSIKGSLDEYIEIKNKISINMLRREFQEVLKNISTKNGVKLAGMKSILEDLVEEMIGNFDSTTLSKLSFLKHVNPVSFSRSLQVAILTGKLQYKLDDSKDKVLDAFTAGLLANIGYLYVTKDKEENHPLFSGGIIYGNVNFEIYDAIFNHHENLNGSGVRKNINPSLVAQMINLSERFVTEGKTDANLERIIARIKYCSLGSLDSKKPDYRPILDPKLISVLEGFMEPDPIIVNKNLVDGYFDTISSYSMSVFGFVGLLKKELDSLSLQVGQLETQEANDILKLLGLSLEKVESMYKTLGKNILCSDPSKRDIKYLDPISKNVEDFIPKSYNLIGHFESLGEVNPIFKKFIPAARNIRLKSLNLKPYEF